MHETSLGNDEQVCKVKINILCNLTCPLKQKVNMFEIPFSQAHPLLWILGKDPEAA